MEKIARAIAGMFLGSTDDLSLEETLDGLCVWVNDNRKGYPIQEVLAAIAKQLG